MSHALQPAPESLGPSSQSEAVQAGGGLLKYSPGGSLLGKRGPTKAISDLEEEIMMKAHRRMSTEETSSTQSSSSPDSAELISSKERDSDPIGEKLDQPDPPVKSPEAEARTTYLCAGVSSSEGATVMPKVAELVKPNSELTSPEMYEYIRLKYWSGHTSTNRPSLEGAVNSLPELSTSTKQPKEPKPKSPVKKKAPSPLKKQPSLLKKTTTSKSKTGSNASFLIDPGSSIEDEYATLNLVHDPANLDEDWGEFRQWCEDNWPCFRTQNRLIKRFRKRKMLRRRYAKPGTVMREEVLLAYLEHLQVEAAKEEEKMKERKVSDDNEEEAPDEPKAIDEETDEVKKEAASEVELEAVTEDSVSSEAMQTPAKQTLDALTERRTKPISELLAGLQADKIAATTRFHEFVILHGKPSMSVLERRCLLARDEFKRKQLKPQLDQINMMIDGDEKFRLWTVEELRVQQKQQIVKL